MMDNIYNLINGAVVTTPSLEGGDKVYLSTEGSTFSLSRFLDDAIDNIASVLKRIANTDAYVQVPTPKSRAEVENLAGQYGWSSLSKVRCFVPSKMNGKVSIHVETVLEQARMFNDYEERILKPLTNYCASVIAAPALIDSPMVMTDFKALNTDKLKKDLARTFNMDEVLADMPYESSFGKAYSNVQDVVATADNLKDLKEVMGGVDLSKLIKGEKRLAELLDELINLLNKENANKAFIKTMAESVSAASIELEYIAALAYYTTANVNAFNESIEHVQRTLER